MTNKPTQFTEKKHLNEICLADIIVIMSIIEDYSIINISPLHPEGLSTISRIYLAFGEFADK